MCYFCSLTQTYSYDSVSRLTGATEVGGTGWTQSYQYAVNGNRWVSNNVGLPALTLETPQAQSWYSSSSVPNRINSWTYDANGNVLQVSGMSRGFSYDAENRQVEANIAGNVTTYFYDGLGQRVSKTGNGQTTTYVYDAFGNLAAEYGPADPSPCATATCYVTVDYLGSTRMLTDASGSSNMRRYDYQPFGAEILAGSGGRTTAMGYLTAPDDFGPKFTGQFRDPESGLDWFNVRHMSGAQGRFQSPDPANAGADPADPQTWNAYSYVGNNPLSLTDPTGLGGEGTIVGGSICGPVCAGIGAAVDLGLALWGIFGGGGSHVDLGPLASDVSGPWNEQPPTGGPLGGPLNTGGVFGSGNTGGVIFSEAPVITPGGLPDTVYTIDGLKFLVDAWGAFWATRPLLVKNDKPIYGLSGMGTQVLQAAGNRAAPIANPCFWGAWTIDAAAAGAVGAATANASEIGAALYENRWPLFHGASTWVYRRAALSSPGLLRPAVTAATQIGRGVNSACMAAQ